MCILVDLAAFLAGGCPCSIVCSHSIATSVGWRVYNLKKRPTIHQYFTLVTFLVYFWLIELSETSSVMCHRWYCTTLCFQHSENMRPMLICLPHRTLSWPNLIILSHFYIRQFLICVFVCCVVAFNTQTWSL
jgi:hypothetical protein